MSAIASARRADEHTLRALVPLGALSPARLAELVEVCFIEQVAAGADAFRVQAPQGQAIYLINGELEIGLADGTRLLLAAGTAAATHPLGRRGAPLKSAHAVRDSEIIRIDDDLLDIMATWDQLAGAEITPAASAAPAALAPAPVVSESAAPADWSMLSGVFSVKALTSGPLSQLPPAHIDELLRRFTRINVSRGDVIVKQGAEGDYYYLVESGRCEVSREIGGATVNLAEIKSGDAFGEEALVSGARRNATVTMKSNGVLLRLTSADFADLLKQPLLKRVDYAEAQRLVAAGARWLDVRYPSEFQYDRLQGAVNVPLSEIRNAFGLLDSSHPYVVYCQTGTRSSAAAFLLAQRGYRASLLERGLAGAGRGG